MTHTKHFTHGNAKSLSRRDLLKLAAAGTAAASACGWLDLVAAEAARQPDRARKACIVLWMAGGPSHLDTFDPKPESPDAGEFKPIGTSVPGIQVTDQLPLLAKEMHRLAILRSMSTGEGSHERATFLMHTGFRMGQPFAYPGLGAIVSREVGEPLSGVPNFVTLGGVRIGTSPGYLGPQHAPLVVQNPAKGVENLSPPGGEGAFREQARLLDFLEDRFRRSHGALEPVRSHKAAYESAVQFMGSAASRAFRVDEEAPHVRETYGKDAFGTACLAARRLVEAGVSFVEVPFGGWDTHGQNFEKLRKLLPSVDRAMSALIRDLADRGLLDSTLVVWMGEFGRTPKVNNKAGRDHYAKAWSTVLAGGGVPGGQVVGRTDKLGAAVEERPIRPNDFLATVSKLLDVDYTKTYHSPRGRPIRIVEPGEKLIEEVVGAGAKGASAPVRWF
jgi:uncharacterized protein (DUF1501 family)